MAIFHPDIWSYGSTRVTNVGMRLLYFMVAATPAATVGSIEKKLRCTYFLSPVNITFSDTIQYHNNDIIKNELEI